MLVSSDTVCGERDNIESRMKVSKDRTSHVTLWGWQKSELERQTVKRAKNRGHSESDGELSVVAKAREDSALSICRRNAMQQFWRGSHCETWQRKCKVIRVPGLSPDERFQ